MGPMPKKKSLTVRRVLVLLLAYIMLAVCGGVATSVLLIPGVIGANNVAKAVIPSLKVENVDFDVTSLPQKSTMYASDGTTVITDFYSQNRIVVPLKKISKVMQQAVVAREDRRFWTHAGVDVQGVMRAFVNTYLLKGDQQGGSSLTQQYVKNVLLMQAIEDNDSIAQYHATEDTVARKIREMLISVQMEKKYTKARFCRDISTSPSLVATCMVLRPRPSGTSACPPPTLMQCRRLRSRPSPRTRTSMTR